MPPVIPVSPAADPTAIAPELEPMLGAVNAGVDAAAAKDTDQEALRIKQAEENAVKALWEEYDQARKFDKDARSQYAVDRRYAAGTANLNWAVSANLIGAFNDILVSFLYARNPDVSVKKAARIDNSGTAEEDDFAKTLELVISSLWRAPLARLKHNIRTQVRSTLTVGVGWIKCILVSTGANIPQMKAELNDARDNLARLESMRAGVTVDADGNQVVLDGNDVKSIEELDVETAKFRELEASISQRMEVAVRKGLAVDYVAAEDIQVSLDVRSVDDYLSAGWMANAIYRPIKNLPALFPGLTDEDCKQAVQYFQKANKELTNLSERVVLTGMADSSVNADEAEQYVSASSKGSTGAGDDRGIAFGKVVELWNRETGHVHTMIEGLKKWAKQPYQPDYASSRFFPYFNVSFYPVDGARHPQSLDSRLMKLQDEYCSTRSSLRLTRSRAAPGTLFNSSGLAPEEVRKIERSTHQEFTGIKPTAPDQPMRDLFAEKPVSIGDMRLYDTTPITQDMEKISGVQDALQSSVTPEKTATEAEIQQSGFASRTTADRDVLETMLGELAYYTAELAVQALDPKDATRIAGAKAFWPHGMALDDLLTMVEVSIEAGTTGKPKSAGDKNAWGVVLPLIQAMQIQIQQAQMMGNQPLADAQTELLKETMVRMGDETDVTRFIPQMPQLPPPVPGMPGPGGPPGIGGPPGMPPDPNAPPPGAEGAPPMPPPMAPGIPDGVQPDSLAGQMVPPELMPPELIPPDLQPPIL